MKVGDYVRTKNGIEKIIDISESITFADYEKTITTNKKDYKTIQEHCELLKSSPNIIDLIEVGDYVNGLPVESVCGTRWDENDLRVWLAVATKYKKEYGVENSEGSYEFETLYRCIKPENIKSIVTKENFESMEYRIGE